MTIDTASIKFPEKELAGLLQFFPRDDSGNHVVRYNFVEAGRVTDPLLNHDFKGTTSIAFSSEEIAFIESVFERLSTTIAIQPQAVTSFNAPQQLDIASVERIPGDKSVDGVVDTWVPVRSGSGELKTQESYVTAHLELNHDSGLSNYEKNLIIHELGHALGLEHPDGKPNSRKYDDLDTVMSYNKGGATHAEWYSTDDLQALSEIWGAHNEGAGSPTTTDPFLIDQLVSGGVNLPEFNPDAGDILSIEQDLLPKASKALKIVNSRRGLNKAAKKRKLLVFDDRTNQLYLNHNRQSAGWGENGGLLATFADDVFLMRQDIQLV